MTSNLHSRLGSKHHLVQFYGEESLLARSVATYLKEGIVRGEYVALVATPEHVRLFSRQLETEGVRFDDLAREGRLAILDAEQTLASFQVDNEPDWRLFENTVGRLILDLKARSGPAGLRAYGEMVNLLWQRGQLAAAMKLEEFWNRLQERESFGLFCAYTVDLLAPEAATAALEGMISAHTHVLPVHASGHVDAAVNRAMNDVLGPQTVAALMPLVRANVVGHAVLPETERTVLWLRRNLPPYADRVLARARRYYEGERARAGCAAGAP
jgi:hypothetical protein